eukprot:5169338-Pyramimonas_sp.AAC.1
MSRHQGLLIVGCYVYVTPPGGVHGPRRRHQQLGGVELRTVRSNGESSCRQFDLTVSRAADSSISR